jgi:hypothetical protein
VRGNTHEQTWRAARLSGYLLPAPAAKGSDNLTRVPELLACLRRLLEGENVGLSIAYTAPRTGKYL